ncbi:MAG: hypothetical protein IPP29_09745 [Bacteroidetes bacterium]|nr:hypothetical protein [Bacteroidota bacterium]
MNDYMWLYNLYRIAFATNPDVQSVPYSKESFCPCTDVINPGLSAHCSVCLGGLCTLNDFTIGRKFSNYLDFGCEINEYINKDLLISNGNKFGVQTNFTVCNHSHTDVVGPNSELIIGEPSGDIYTHGEFIVASEHLGCETGGKITVEKNSKLVIKKGAEFKILNGGKLEVKDGGRVIVENGGKLIYGVGADIQLLGDNAVLEIAGDLELQNDAVFTFTYPGANSGYVKFSNVETDIYTPTENIIYGTNSKINIHGQGKTDKVLEVTQESIYTSGAANGTCAEFRLTDGKVEMSTNARLNLDCPVFINNSTIASSFAPGAGTARGIDVFGQPSVSISNSDFIGLQKGINGLLFYGGKSLSVPGCNFIYCGRG